MLLRQKQTGGTPTIRRVATHEPKPEGITSEGTRNFRDWLKKQPGFVGGYHTRDSETGTVTSITVRDSEESLLALKNRTPPGGPISG